MSKSDTFLRLDLVDIVGGDECYLLLAKTSDGHLHIDLTSNDRHEGTCVTVDPKYAQTIKDYFEEHFEEKKDES